MMIINKGVNLMKRSALSLAVAAALAGVAGSASAQTATQFVATQSGVGHHLVVPYYSTQSGNTTLINLVNTDTVNGKAVKVRFRGASNSDDVLDFQVLMSPGDMWAANVSAGPDGIPVLTTPDTTCTIPSTVRTSGAKFSFSRINQDGLADSAKINELREGYVEILTMADIPTSSASSTTNIFTAIKHNAGVAPCTVTVLEGTAGVATSGLQNSDTRLTLATAGLFGNWTIINVASTRTFTGEATALRGVDNAGVAGTLKNVYFRQSTVNFTGAEQYSADPLFDPAVGGGTALLQAQTFDLPDLSTPSLSGAADPEAQRDAVSFALAGYTWATEFLSSNEVSFETDIVLSQPTRRYYVAIDYATGDPIFSPSNEEYYEVGNIEAIESSNGLVQACLLGVTPTFYNREEGVPVTPASPDIGVSPGTPSDPADPLALCGEVAVVSINGLNVAPGVYSPTLNANITLANVTTTTEFANGWIHVMTPGGGTDPTTGIPVIGHQMSRAFNPAASAGTSGNFGGRWNLRVLVPGTPIP